MKKINKALIAAAGYGTRFFPLTKTIQKEMLPVLNYPFIYYNVMDLVNAGIEEIIFIVNEKNSQIEHFFSSEETIQNYLKAFNKEEKYEPLIELPNLAKFTFINQKVEDGYGTGVPVKIAKDLLKDEEAFLVFMGDDFIFNAQQFSESKAMIDLYNQSDSEALVTAITKPEDELSKYGVLETTLEGDYQFMKSVVEKPESGTAPSNLVNISKYIFTPKVFELLEDQSLDSKSGELYITDTILNIAQQSKVVIYTPKGEHLDSGAPLLWLKANLYVAMHNPDMKEDLMQFMKKFGEKLD